MTDTALTDADRALLERPLHGLLTITPGRDRLPAPRPVWFEVTDGGDLALFSMADAVKVRRLGQEPRATLVVVAPAEEPEAWVSIEADVAVHADGGEDLAARLARRYWAVQSPEQRARAQEWAVAWVEENLRRVVLHPTRVTRGPVV